MSTAVGRHKASRIGAEVIDQIRSAFGLSTADVAALFGVTRPAVQQWRVNGVPVTRAADVDRVRELSEVFLRKFIPARVPQIVRTPGRGLGGKSVLAIIAEGGVEPVYAYLERLFAYTP
ncbi:MAG TPA: helix-turn-helix transcriptional regulator [Candidatus Baltobacteraceae bacterium]|nr:helix-turn-helix transcriptional regulator [Candidatus Baltobacteraceae bacterium]